MSNQTIDEILNSYVPATDYSDKRESDPTDRERAKTAIQAHINAEIAKVLDRIENSPNGAYSGTQAHMMINDTIRAERNKLKEVK